MSDAFNPNEFIQVAVKTVEQHFSGELCFHLPWFQRAYAWNEDHADRLLHDILEASQSTRGRYFLGHVMLARPNGEAQAAIIDGHQRSLTLTILFALIRDRAPDEEIAHRMHRLLIKPGNDGERARFRITPQPTNSDFFSTYVQRPGATLTEAGSGLPESEQKFLDNRDRLAKTLDENLQSQDAWSRLATFLLSRCFLLVEVVQDEDEAWEMLSIEETTGLDFHSSDRSKVALISVMEHDVQDEAGQKWDIWRARLGADGMMLLLGHIRSLRSERRSSKPVEQSLIELYGLNRGGLAFIDTVLVPQAENYHALRNNRVGAGVATPKIAQALDYLNWLEREAWVPAALSWLEHKSSDDPETPRFFTLLDRLAWVLRIAGRDPVEQERRFMRIVSAVRDARPLGQIVEFNIEDRILSGAIENLLSRTFYDKGYSRLVLRRLSKLQGGKGRQIDGDKATVEHILPRRPARGSKWFRAFPNKNDINQNVHRLGNLAILSFDDNQKAGSKDFVEKKPILAGSDFTMSQQIASLPNWTPDVITERSIEMARALLASWNLEFSFN
ncbi:MAG: DUF262 domain-containing protein [Hyphomicrobiaceae bacterium]